MDEGQQTEETRGQQERFGFVKSARGLTFLGNILGNIKPLGKHLSQIDPSFRGPGV